MPEIVACREGEDPSVVRACVWFVAGVFAPQLNSFSVDTDHIRTAKVLLDFPALAGILAACVISGVACAPRRWRIGVAAFCLGVAAFSLQAAIVIASRLDPAFEGDSLLTEIQVVEFPRTSGATTSFVAAPVDDSRVPRRVRLSWFEAPVAVRLGDTWQAELRLRRPRGSSNPGGMDFEGWLFRDRTLATGYVVRGKHNRLLGSGAASRTDQLRLYLLERIRKAAGDGPDSAVLAAIMAGARQGITTAQWERYARTGTSHLMAISGLHVGLVAGGTYLLLLLLQSLSAVQRSRRGPALAAGVLAAAAYAVLSGLAVPAQRAATTVAIAALVLAARRELRPLVVLPVVAAAVAAADPLSTMAPGYQLSFAAVGVLAWYARRSGGGTSVVAPLEKATALLPVQVWLLAGLAPLTVAVFDRVALLAPLVNLVAVPLFSFLTVPLAMLGLLLGGPLETAGNTLLRVAATTIGWLEAVIDIAASIEPAALVIPDRTGLAWLSLILPLLWAILPSGWPGRWAAWLGFVALLSFRPASPPAACVDVTYLDVGQGLAVVIRTRQRTLLYDAGPAWQSGGDAGERVVVPFLQSRGIRRIDLAMISHSDLDHAGGLASVRAAVPVARVLSGDALGIEAMAATRCRAGQSWRWDGIALSVLHPAPGDAPGTSNSASCVLLVEAGEQRMLLPGDIEAAEEAQLVRRRVLPSVSVAAVPHHGSRTSSIMPFVRELSPEYAVVSAAFANQWGFPKPDIVARWRNAGAQLLNTANSGAIRIEMCREAPRVRVSEHRVRSWRPWHAEM